MTPLFRYGGRDSARFELARAHMQVAIAEANDAVQRRVDANAQSARKLADQFRTVAVSAEALMSAPAPAPSPDDPSIVPQYRAAELLAALMPMFVSVFEEFDREHGAAHIESAVRDTLRKYADWALAQPAVLRPLWKEYVARYEAGLEKAAAEQQAITDDWSAVDGDGFDDAADPR